MENKLNLIKTLLNSIVQRWKLLEKLDMNAKGMFEQLINMKDQLEAIKTSQYDDSEIFVQIDELAELKIEIERLKLQREIQQNNENYKELIDKIEETNKNLNKIVADQKQPSSRAGQLCFILDRISNLIQQLNQNLDIRYQVCKHSNPRFALLNYLHKPPVDDFHNILDLIVQF